MELIKEILKDSRILNRGLLYADEARVEGIKFNNPEPEPINCEFCGKVLRSRGLCVVNGSISIWMKHDRCNCEKAQEYWKVLDEEQEKAKVEEGEQERRIALQTKVSRLFEQSKLGERFKSRTFENFTQNKNNERAYNAAKKYSENFKQYKSEGAGIIFSGTYGTGKTHLAAAISIELINQGIPVVFGTLINLLGKIRQTYHNDEDEWEVLNIYTSADLLVIDDLGKEKPSEWVLEKLYSIVNDRYENNKPIIITTNYDHETLVKRLTVNGNCETAESIVSRLYEMCRGVVINGEDHRKT
jgi:DNA replication protein DnaC